MVGLVFEGRQCSTLKGGNTLLFYLIFLCCILGVDVMSFGGHDFPRTNELEMSTRLSPLSAPELLVAKTKLVEHETRLEAYS